MMYTLENIPMASEQHCASIGEVIGQICVKFGLTEEDRKRRERIVDLLTEIFEREGIGETRLLFIPNSEFHKSLTRTMF